MSVRRHRYILERLEETPYTPKTYMRLAQATIWRRRWVGIMLADDLGALPDLGRGYRIIDRVTGEEVMPKEAPTK